MNLEDFKFQKISEFRLIKVLINSSNSYNFYAFAFLRKVLGFEKENSITAYKLRDIFRTQSKICNKAFL